MKRTFLAQLTLEEPVIVDPGERFVVRFGEEQMAGGEILLKGRPKWLNRGPLIEFCKRLADDNFEESILWFAQNSPYKTLTRETLARFLPVQSREPAVKTLIEKERLLEIGDFILDPGYLKDVQALALTKLIELENRLNDSEKRLGINLEQLRTAINPPPERAVLSSVVDTLTTSGRLVRNGEKLSSPAAKERVAVDPKTIACVEEALAANVCIEIVTLSTLCRVKQSEIDRALDQLENEGKAKRIAHDFVCSVKALDSAHSVLAGLWEEKRDITPSEFKERMNITRKYAMAMLSHFDDTQVTRRMGNGQYCSNRQSPLRGASL